MNWTNSPSGARRSRSWRADVMSAGVASVAVQVSPAPRSVPAADSSASAHFTLGLADTGDAAAQAVSGGKDPVSRPAPASDATGKDALTKGAPAAKPIDGGMMAWLLSVLAPSQPGTPSESGDAAESGVEVAPNPPDARLDTAISPKAAGKGAPAEAPPAQASGNPPTDHAMPPPAAPSGPRAGADTADDGAQPDAPATVLKELTPSVASRQLQLTDSSVPQAPNPATVDTAAGIASFARTLAASGADPGPSVSPPASHMLQSPDHPEWPLALADQVQWQLGNEVQEARFELHPRDLGSVQVQVRITSEGAEVRFAATHPQAREALAAAMPQLRALLVGDGLLTTQTHVGSQSSWQSPNHAAHSPQLRPGVGGAAGDEEEAPVMARVVRIGLIDDFA